MLQLQTWQSQSCVFTKLGRKQGRIRSEMQKQTLPFFEAFNKKSKQTTKKTKTSVSRFETHLKVAICAWPCRSVCLSEAVSRFSCLLPVAPSLRSSDPRSCCCPSSPSFPWKRRSRGNVMATKKIKIKQFKKKKPTNKLILFGLDPRNDSQCRGHVGYTSLTWSQLWFWCNL